VLLRIAVVTGLGSTNSDMHAFYIDTVVLYVLLLLLFSAVRRTDAQVRSHPFPPSRRAVSHQL
jgi:hypothetical protein